MRLIRPLTLAAPLPLFGVEASRRIESLAAAPLPPHALMQRAGLAVARLAMAIAPRARSIWIACGPGNNGGDGFEAALHLAARGFAPVVTFAGDEARLPQDAAASLRRLRAAGVALAGEPPAQSDLTIDALLGLGARRAPEGTMADWLRHMRCGPAPLLSVDLPSGLDADSGGLPADAGTSHASAAPRFCLSLLTLKPGLFTAQGRDAAGEVWFDGLGCPPPAEVPPDALLAAVPAPRLRPHASHKGSYGDVAVIGGAEGMAGAAVLAATAALHAGAGRVFVGLLAPSATSADWDTAQPELMFRAPDTLALNQQAVVCGCGGGEAVRAVLPRLIDEARALVLDADALNALALDAALREAVARRAGRGQPTVLTPHPLEAARLAGCGTAEIQADRLRHAHELAQALACTVLLKGSGSVIASPGETPRINPTGNALLATAGTGDVLAGMVGAALAAGLAPLDAACQGAWRHGELADRWEAGTPLTAAALARRAGRAGS
ncbi:MAG: NAD(P)H-hydrate dehydratase [Xenophilus sp.]